MKVIDKINKAEEEGRTYWSFEYFPPKTEMVSNSFKIQIYALFFINFLKGVQNLYDRMERMQRYGPEFIDVTWGAGGTSADLTTEIVATAQSVYGLETMMHLTCTNMPVKQIDDALEVSYKSMLL